MTLRPRLTVRFLIGAGLFFASWAEALGGRLPPYEEQIFRAANGASDSMRVPVRAVMQAGTFMTVPIAATIAFLAGRRRLAAKLLAGGTIAWVGAKAIKPLGGRQRPKGVLDEGVVMREKIEGDLGWVSGHTAVATTLAFAAGRSYPGGPARFSGAWSGRSGSAGCTSGRTCPTTSSAASAWG